MVLGIAAGAAEQRVALGIALATRPAFLIADEPGELDATAVRVFDDHASRPPNHAVTRNVLSIRHKPLVLEELLDAKLLSARETSSKSCSDCAAPAAARAEQRARSRRGSTRRVFDWRNG